MYSLPLAALLIPYGIVLIIFSIFALVNIFHLIHYGAATSSSFMVTFVFLATTILILFFTFQLTLGTDWSQAMQLQVPNLDKSLFPLQ